MAKKQRAPTILLEAEWAFHKVPQKELRCCAEWELARLCGKQQEPWLKLTKAKKERLLRIITTQTGLHEVPSAFIPLFKEEIPNKYTPGMELITLLVDFSESDASLVKSFRNWLRSSKTRKKWRKKSGVRNTRWRGLLAKIVVLRTHEAGLTRKAAQEETAELWRHWQLDKASAGFLSPEHWSRALSEAKALRVLWVSQTFVALGDPPCDTMLWRYMFFIDKFPRLVERGRMRTQ
jgi:hypothetical protein